MFRAPDRSRYPAAKAAAVSSCGGKSKVWKASLAHCASFPKVGDTNVDPQIL